jgi:ribosomal protein S12 methylthiotransferase accessory factor
MEAAQLWTRLNTEAALLRSHGSAEPNSDRFRSASDTVARMRPEFERFGITRLAEVTGLDRVGIPVWMAIRPNSKTLAVSQGKGLSDAAAQASAVMEAAELATAEGANLRTRLCSAQDLRAENERAELLHNLVKRGQRPPAVDEELAWVTAFDLIAGSPVWVPAEVVRLDRTSRENEPGTRYWQSSDGLASGNLLIEAVVHGLCERIERDASVLWQFRSERDVCERCIAPEEMDDPAVQSLARRVEEAGLSLRLFDITSDIGVPVFFATISPALEGLEHHGLHFDLSSGMGCHPSPARAAIRAITEAAQSRVTSITGARDDFDPNLYATRLTPDVLTYLRARPGKSNRAAADNAVPANPADNLHLLLSSLQGAGVSSVIVVPLAASEPGFAVAKVLIPELENPPGERRQHYGKRALRAMAGLQ